MKLGDKLQMLRKKYGFSQEELAQEIGVSRQTVGKWETGQAVPEVSALVRLSDIYKVTIDRMIRDNDCFSDHIGQSTDDLNPIIDFLICAKRNTYAAHGARTISSRPSSYDLEYRDGDYYYLDTYIGSEHFCGEEAVWVKGSPVWSMNYSGRVTDENFSGDFLKEALMQVPYEAPYRGPVFFQHGDYSYHCVHSGDMSWFQGYEEILYLGKKIYECFFHGGKIV